MQNCVVWRAACDCRFALILAGDTLFAGGEGKLRAYRARDGQQVWTADVNGSVYGLAVANGRLFASTDRGKVYCFSN